MSLGRDFDEFARRRAHHRPLLTSLIGFAAIAWFGALAGTVPVRQAEVTAALVLTPVIALVASDILHWRRLRRRLDRARTELQAPKKS